MPSSRLPGFHQLDPIAKREDLVAMGWLSREQAQTLARGVEPIFGAEGVVASVRENLSLVTNLVVNGRDVLVPMVTEEASVVAAACRGSLLLRGGGGVEASGGERLLGAQIPVELPGAGVMPWEWDLELVPFLQTWIREHHPRLCAAGGGVRSVRLLPVVPVRTGPTLVPVLLELGVGDAMGAAVADRIADAARRFLAERFGIQGLTSIVTNEPLGRSARARGRVPVDLLARAGRSGAEVALDVERLCDWARGDRLRRVTHLKGFMNGLMGVMSAFRQDTRAVEAGVWSAVFQDGDGLRMPSWRVEEDCLVGEVELPVVCGVVDSDELLGEAGAVLRGLAGITRAVDLEAVGLAVGLAQNLAALQTLVSEGIVSGHGRLHQARRST